jgi:hydroxymethylpyrimidine pyrophosphatase-like HAD family hydrolase
VQHMVIAIDVDGTLYDGSGVAEEASAALRSARAVGHRVVIVTGRRWEGLDQVVPGLVELCDRVVCEDGGVVVNVATGQLTLLAAPVDRALVEALEAAGVPSLDVGHVTVGAPSSASALVTEVRDRLGGCQDVVTNKGSVSLSPAGCDKGVGLRAAMRELGLEHLPILAIGDAANDLPMFAMATIAVGVGNADEAVRRSGVVLMHSPTGRGVAEALRRFLPTPTSS